MALLMAVERHLRRTGERPAQFGRRVARDPNLVRDMRNGREPGPRMRRRILSALEEKG